MHYCLDQVELELQQEAYYTVSGTVYGTVLYEKQWRNNADQRR